MAEKMKHILIFFFSGLACLSLFALASAPISMAQAAAWPTVTRTVTPYRSPTPSRTPTPSSMTSRSMSTVNMGDIIQELKLFGSGAGAGTNCPSKLSKPGLDEVITTAQLMNPVSLWTCGWKPGEIVLISGLDPYGKSLGVFQMQAGYGDNKTGMLGNIVLDFQPDIDAPTGKYKFSFAGQSGTITTNVWFTRPNGPHMYLLSSNPWQPVLGMPMGNRHDLLLWNFRPGETVRLLIYNDYCCDMKRGNVDADLLGYQDYIVPPGGQMQVKIDMSGAGNQKFLFIDAYGSKSGNVPLSWFDRNEDQAPHHKYDLYCPGAMPSRIVIDQYRVRAAYVDGTNLRIRAQPGFYGQILKTVPEGTVIDKYGSHEVRCVDKTFWWQVVLPGSKTETGWIAETYNGKYILESIPNP